MYVNAVYYPNWRFYSNQRPSSLRLHMISHVFYAFAQVGPDGNVSLSDQWADAQVDVDGAKGCLRAFGALKRKYTALKLILSIGGGTGSEPFASVAGNPVTRGNFARSAKGLVQEFRLDGIDIDWEHPSDRQQGEQYIKLLAALRASLPSPRYMLTSALPAGEWALRNIDLGRASAYLDFIIIMGYDFSGPWTVKTGHQAQLFTPRNPNDDAARTSCDSAITYCLSHGVAPNKLLLGIPVYGRSFLGADGPDQAYAGNGGRDGTFQYKDLPRADAQEYVDHNVGAAFCVGGDGGFASYDNPQTVKMKAQYVKEKGLAGLVYWTGTGDAQDAARSLIYSGFNALHS